jgi:hypothetical protein
MPHPTRVWHRSAPQTSVGCPILRYDTTVRVIGLTVAAAALATGCTRDPAPAECPDVGVGDLVVTEIRGPQSGSDTLGTWVELYNASGGSLDLKGLKIRFRKKDGSSETDVLVRRSVQAAAGAYVVLGLFPDDDTRPSYVDYGFASDFHVSFLPAAAVDVEACGTRIDRAIYDQLPNMGTYELGAAPDADANDLPTNWCTDATISGTTYPGTPQQPNPACP